VESTREKVINNGLLNLKLRMLFNKSTKHGFGSILKTTLIFILALASVSFAGDWPSILHVYRGTAPKLDGIISPGEYDDATSVSGVRHWLAYFNEVLDSNDYSVVIWAKHDGKSLYFALDVIDDVLYGVDTPMWLPDKHPKVHELTREGFPWFGDGVELLINASNKWSQADKVYNEGNGKSWQMVCSAIKSRKHGIGKGGLLEGEQRAKLSAWNTYGKWIKDGAMDAVVKNKPGGKGYVIEWMIKANPCLEVRDGIFWNPQMGMVRMGLNIAIQDLDTHQAGAGNWANFNHENWWAGNKKNRTWPKAWGSMYLHPETGADHFAPAGMSNSRTAYHKPLKIELDNLEEKIAKSTTFYISVRGSDKYTGSKEKPLATITKAKKLIRELIKKGLRKDVLVLLRAGTYKITDTIVFTEQDSGNDNHSIIYAAYPGEKVVISGQAQPCAGKDVAQLSPKAPAVETLIKVQGTPNRPVSNIKFYGLTFAHTAQPGFAGNTMSSAIYIAAAKKIRFERNVFTHLGQTGVDLHYAASENQFVGNVFSNISGNALQLAKFPAPDVGANRDDKRNMCVDNIIENNFFIDNGVVYKKYFAIICGRAKGTIIEYNEVTKMPCSGFGVGYDCRHVPNAMGNNKIRYNHIHNVRQSIADTGAVCVLSYQSGTEIGYNYIHDLSVSKQAAWTENAIYLDESSKGITIHHNVLEKAGSRSLSKHRVGQNNICFNNLIDTSYDSRIQTWQYKNSDVLLNMVKNKAGLEPAYREIKNKLAN